MNSADRSRWIGVWFGSHLAVSLAAVSSLQPVHVSRRVVLLHGIVVTGLMILAFAGLVWMLGRERRRNGRFADAQRTIVATIATMAVSLLALLYVLDFIGNRSWRGNLNYAIAQQYASMAAPNRSPFFIPAWVHLTVLAAVCALFAFYWWSAPIVLDAAAVVRRVGTSLFIVGGVAYFGCAVLVARLAWRPDLLNREPVISFFLRTDNVFDFNQYSVDRELPRLERAARDAYPKVEAFTKKNVVLITVDSLRADHMGVYGYQRPTTPFLTRLFEEGRLNRVDVALSTCSETNCGVLSILMSKWFRHLAPESFSLTELLQRQGYDVFQILSGWHGLRRAYGHDQTMYFDGASSQYGTNDDRSVFEGLRRVPAFHATPAFFHFHLMSPHVVGEKQARFRRYEPARAMYLGQVFTTDDDRLASLNNYDNGVLQADAMIQEIFGELERKGYLANSMVTIIADHGEGLGEHGLDKVGHSVWLYQEYIRIPYLIYDAPAARYRSLSRASQVDVAPTIVDRLGLPVPRTWEGRSLLDGSIDRYTYHQTGRWDDACYAVTSRYAPPDFKYIRCNAGIEEELYDLSADPSERHNLMSAAPAALVQQFSDTLRAHLTGSARR